MSDETRKSVLEELLGPPSREEWLDADMTAGNMDACGKSLCRVADEYRKCVDTQERIERGRLEGYSPAVMDMLHAELSARLEGARLIHDSLRLDRIYSNSRFLRSRGG